MMILTSIKKKIETALLKTRNMQPDYRGRVNWNMHSVVVQCLYLPTSMLLLTLAMMGALWFSENNSQSGYEKIPFETFSISPDNNCAHLSKTQGLKPRWITRK